MTAKRLSALLVLALAAIALIVCAGLAAGLGMTLEDVCQLNVDKLRRRYPDGFDPERSRHREAGDL